MDESMRRGVPLLLDGVPERPVGMAAVRERVRFVQVNFAPGFQNASSTYTATTLPRNRSLVPRRNVWTAWHSMLNGHSLITAGWRHPSWDVIAMS
jgi:hypothetical protein